MKKDEIIRGLTQITSFDSQFLLFETDIPSAYYGRTREGLLVFALDSQNKKLPRFMQETNSLSFCFNEKGLFTINGIQESRIIHLLICKENDPTKEDAFIRLTYAFSLNEVPDEPFYVAKLFAALSSLFDKRHVASEIEMQGLYGELFSIIYFHENGCDISKYWQSEDRMKYDFTINNQKRLEIKTTTRSVRIHHFKHGQLMSRSYEIYVVSIMLQKSDGGLSLLDIISTIRELYQTNYDLILHIESIISGIDDNELERVQYDEQYLRRNIKIYDAKTIPHFGELTPEGVINAEYDSSLTNIENVDIHNVIGWIQGE